MNKKLIDPGPLSDLNEDELQALNITIESWGPPPHPVNPIEPPPPSTKRVSTCGIKYTAFGTPWNGTRFITVNITLARRMDELNAQCRNTNWRGLSGGHNVTCVVKSDFAGSWAYRDLRGQLHSILGGAPALQAPYNFGTDERSVAGNLLFFPPKGLRASTFRMHIVVDNEPYLFTGETFYQLDRDGNIFWDVTF